MINNILNNENKEYLNFMEEIGFIPKLYYDSKLTNFDNYRNFLKLYFLLQHSHLLIFIIIYSETLLI